MAPGAIDWHLLNDFQHGFPLVPQPYHEIAARLHCPPGAVMDGFAGLRSNGTIDRIGPVFRANMIGASTLAAVRVPPARLDAVAARVSACPNVNHNYQRDHDVNLWFVAAAPDRPALDALLAALADDIRSPVLRMPLVREYRIDLGFDLAGDTRRDPSRLPPAGPPLLTEDEWRLARACRAGLPIVMRPYASLAARAGADEAHTMRTLARWVADGIINRLGVVVRHRELGFRANAMAVWDVPDDQVDTIGAVLAQEPGVTLCYRRARVAPDATQPVVWPYNLYCMVHGRERATVQRRIADAAAKTGLQAFPSAVLFGMRRFKQTGANPFGDVARTSRARFGDGKVPAINGAFSYG